MVTSVEKAATQYNFIRKVAQTLNDNNIRVVRGDALRFIDSAATSYDLVFADPPYDLTGFGEIPEKVLKSKLLKSGSIFIIEHSKNYNFSQLPHFVEHRAYGSVNFSIFRIE
jgi:16S rRNA G966 N2-methylase RsmD